MLQDGSAVTPTEVDPGTFWFFDQVELVVKVLDACRTDDRFFVLVGNAVEEITITVVDQSDGSTVDLDQGFTPLQDPAAFATCP
jgi:hypothetical protein